MDVVLVVGGRAVVMPTAAVGVLVVGPVVVTAAAESDKTRDQQRKIRGVQEQMAAIFKKRRKIEGFHSLSATVTTTQRRSEVNTELEKLWKKVRETLSTL